MRNWKWALVGGLLMLFAGSAQPQQQDKSATLPPAWAYGFDKAIDPATYVPPPAAPAAAPAPDDGSMRKLPGSNLSFTLTQIRDGYGPADWYPSDHPKMPEIVAHGKKPEVRACSLCHYPNGKGRPENAGVAGLPYNYILQTMSDFKTGARHSADPRKGNTHFMTDFARAMTDDEIKAAAEYFSSMKWTPWIRVVETDTVPKTRIAGGMFLRLEGDATEPLNGRIIETPEDAEATETLRNSRSGFIAYVPTGSVKRGEALVMRGGPGKTVACAGCHGDQLQGNGGFPPLAGRSPSYLARQLYDIQHFARNGAGAELMRPIVQNLTADDIVAVAAYLASRPVTVSQTTAAK
jgi:cytochrome c553